MIRSSMQTTDLTRAAIRRASRLSIIALALCAASASNGFAAEARTGGGVMVTPGGRAVNSGLRTAVLSATDTSGDVDAANAALLAANVALGRVNGFSTVPTADVAAAFGKITLSPRIEGTDIVAIGKATKAKRALTITVSPGEADAQSASYRAVAELFDTATGGLVGRGDGTFTATADAANDKPAADTKGTGDALTNRALSGAVYQAINELNKPASFNGIVVSIPGAYQARISLGERNGVRNGARVEYLRGGEVVGFGSVVDLGTSEAVATVAPESAAPLININTEVRTVSNPTASRAGKSAREIDDADFKKFEHDFAISAAIAGIAYAVVQNN